MRSISRDPRHAFAWAILLVLGALPAAATENPFLGRWTVVETTMAPWVDPKDASTTPDYDKALAHMTITFTKTGIQGPRPFGCKKVQYTLNMTGPEDLFEGGLKNPKEDAAKLGFKDLKIALLNEGCVSNQADFEMDFAMVDPDTIVFGLNNLIYRLKRMP